MPMMKIAAGIVVVLSLNSPATAEIYSIDNPASKINNPADKLYNPATRSNNPASNIYNPVSRMDNPKAPSTPAKPAQTTGAAEVTAKKMPVKRADKELQPKPAVLETHYHYKTVDAYLNSAKKAFVRDDYGECLSITEDALRRINEGNLKASRKSKLKLLKYKAFGTGLLGNLD